MMRRRGLFVHAVILVLAVLVRLGFMQPFSRTLQGDELSYHTLAVSLEEGKGYAMEGQRYSRPPLYPLFVASVYRLFGTGNLRAVYAFQVLLGALTCSLLYEMAKGLFGPSVAFLAALLTLFNLPLAASSFRLLTECLFTLFLIGAFFLLQGGTRKAIALSGVAFAMAAMTKEIAFYLPFLIALILIVSYRREGLRKGAFLVGAFLFAMLPLIVRNYLVYRTFVPVSTQGGYVFYTSYHPLEGKLFGYNVKDETTAVADQFETETERSRYFFWKTVEDIREDPAGAFRLAVLKFLYFWAPFDWEILGEGRYHFLYGFMFPFFLMGCVWAKGRRSLLLIPVVYFLAMALLLYGSPRFRLPIEPFIMVAGAFGLLELFRRLPRQPVGWTFVTTLLIANGGLVLFSAPFKHLLTRSLRLVGLW